MPDTGNSSPPDRGFSPAGEGEWDMVEIDNASSRPAQEWSPLESHSVVSSPPLGEDWMKIDVEGFGPPQHQVSIRRTQYIDQDKEASVV